MNAPQPQPAKPYRKNVSTRTKVALSLILGPTVLIAVTFSIFSLLNLVFSLTFQPTPDTANFAATPVFITILNVILFTIGSIGIVSWLPGIIIGAVLLATKKDKE